MLALFVDNLTAIDFAYFDSARGIVGESLLLSVELSGELNNEGMLFDFSFVKKRIKSCVDNLVDHKFLVARHQAGVTIVDSPTQLSLTLETANQDRYVHISPHQAVCLLDADNVNSLTIAAEIHREIRKILPDNVHQINVTLQQESIDHSYYHYSHGLKKHLGDCQRIAHGHRSKIQVWENQQPSTYWSDHIAEMWRDIYLASEEDIKQAIRIAGKDYWQFEYHANQGLFQLTLPQSRCYLIDNDTTVELIAEQLLQYLALKRPQSHFKVKAFEGVDKGAIAYSSNAV